MDELKGEMPYCFRCDIEMKSAPVRMNYIGHQLIQNFPRCPICGQVYIPEEVVCGRMHQVEMTLEDK